MYFIVAGCGRVGAHLASTLAADGHDVVVIDTKRESFGQLGTHFDGVTLVGNAIDEDVLREAGISGADGFAAVTSNDSVNLMATQIARELFKVHRVVARAFEPKREVVYHDLGIETVCATELGARQLRSLLLAQDVTPRATLGAGEVIEVEFGTNESRAGLTLAELEQAGQFRVYAILAGGVATIPDATYRTAAGDRLMAAVRLDALPSVRHKFSAE